MYIINFILLLIFNLHVAYAIPIVTDTDAETEIKKEDWDSSGYKNTYKACNNVYDPYEKLNRQIYKFNSTIDFIILRPIAKGYDKITNDYVKNRIGGIIQNINTPLTVVNYALQLNYTEGMKSFWRFVINTSFGIGGMFDVATKMGIQSPTQSFGDTLAHYGVGPGPYLILPIFGGTMARNLGDSILTTDYYLPNKVRWPYTIVNTVHQRAKILPFTDHVMETSMDSYVAIRSAIFQNRESSAKYPKNFSCPTTKNN